MRSQGRLYAFDVVAKRLANLSSRDSRARDCRTCIRKLIAHERDTKVKRLAGKIDRVLVDAPCTGFGTLRRNPDLKWRQTPNDLAELTAKQAAHPRRGRDARQARRTRSSTRRAACCPRRTMRSWPDSSPRIRVRAKGRERGARARRDRARHRAGAAALSTSAWLRRLLRSDSGARRMTITLLASRRFRRAVRSR